MAALMVIQKESVETILFISHEVSANTQSNNKQSIPRHADISAPTSGVDIGTHERFVTAYPFRFENFADFRWEG